MNWKPDRKDFLFIGTIVLVHILFFLMALSFKRIYMGDSFEYVYEALNIKNHLFFYSGNAALPIEPEYMTQRQPGYPLFLLAVYLFTVNNWVVIVFQNLLSVLNICYCRSVLLKTGYSKKYDWLLLLLIVAYPAQFINANTIAPDILLQTATLLYLGCFIGLFQSRTPRFAWSMSFALVGGLMVKPVLYPFVFVHLIIIGAFFYKEYGRQVIAAAALPLCVVLLYNGWNEARTGKFHFSSNQSFNAIYYFYSYIDKKQGADSAQKFLRKERGDLALLPAYKDRYDHANGRGTELLRQNFCSYMVFHMQNSARIFIEPGKGEMDLFTGRLTYGGLYSGAQTGFYATLKKKGWGGIGEFVGKNPSMPIILVVLLFNCLRLCGLLAFFFSGNVHLGIRLFIFMLLCYFAVAAGPIANTRYFLPVSLIAIGCSAMGYMGVLEKRKLNQ